MFVLAQLNLQYFLTFSYFRGMTTQRRLWRLSQGSPSSSQMFPSSGLSSVCDLTCTPSFASSCACVEHAQIQKHKPRNCLAAMTIVLCMYARVMTVDWFCDQRTYTKRDHKERSHSRTILIAQCRYMHPSMVLCPGRSNVLNGEWVEAEAGLPALELPEAGLKVAAPCEPSPPLAWYMEM